MHVDAWDVSPATHAAAAPPCCHCVQGLRSLCLAGNDLGGVIVREGAAHDAHWGRLPRSLTSLDLSYCALAALPPELFNVAELKVTEPECLLHATCCNPESSGHTH